jgi:hypothetical protein
VQDAFIPLLYTDGDQSINTQERTVGMPKQLKIVVGGYAVGFPLGGQMWSILHWVLGLARLGCEVIFVEDTADWALPFDPVKGYSSVDSTFGRGVLDELFRANGLAGRWAYYSQFEDRLYGMDREHLETFCAEADLFLNLSGVIPLREIFMKANVKIIVDTDPVFTQYKIENDPWTRDYYNAHDLMFTFGHNIPTGSTGLPVSDIDWHPIHPPVVLEEWNPGNGAVYGFTTIGSWDSKGRDIVINGEQLSWRKCVRYEQIIDLPSSFPNASLELTMSGMKEDAQRFASHGWTVRDALVVSRDILKYRDYIVESMAEFTMAKEQNVRLKSGWFSDRSACYLAAGRPVIVEDTGFGTYLPIGEGLLTFGNLDQAKSAMEDVIKEYPQHRRAARRIAEEFFNARIVLTTLLREADLL